MIRLLVVSALLAACSAAPVGSPTPSGAPSGTPAPTASASETLTPTSTPAPSASPVPTDTELPAPTDSPRPSGPVGVPVIIGTDDTGAFLVTTDGFSLYTFDNDSPGVSTCEGDCAANWPPLTLFEGATPTGGEGVDGTFAQIDRADGTTQVTYNDAPLYLFAGDAAAGDTNGDGVGDVWHLAVP